VATNDKKTTVYGNEEGFHVTVRPAFGSYGYEVTVWNRNSGSGGLPAFTDRDKAERVAAFLYEQLLPEYEEQQRYQKESIEKFMAEQAKKPKPLKIPKNAPRVKVLECPECNKLIPPDDVSDERVYECNNCGTTGTGEDGRRCDQCHKFTAKVSDTSCPECGAAMDDAEEVEAQRATNGTLVKVEQHST
jgi:predicted RNA-binding Zn-ribbon protein involved in translation (DUF1610 family)